MTKARDPSICRRHQRIKLRASALPLGKLHCHHWIGEKVRNEAGSVRRVETRLP